MWDFIPLGYLRFLYHKASMGSDVVTMKKTQNIFVLGMISKVVQRKFWVTVVHAEQELKNFYREQCKTNIIFAHLQVSKGSIKFLCFGYFLFVLKKFYKLWLLRVKNCYRMLSMHRQICSAHPACEENF